MPRGSIYCRKKTMIERHLLKGALKSWELRFINKTNNPIEPLIRLKEEFIREYGHEELLKLIEEVSLEVIEEVNKRLSKDKYYWLKE
jgi:hypothetical protein